MSPPSGDKCLSFASLDLDICEECYSGILWLPHPFMFSHDQTGAEHLAGAENPAGEAFLPALHQGKQDLRGFPGGSDGTGSACSVGDSGSIPALGRFPGEENGNPLQYSCLENPKDRGAWCTTVYEVAKSWTRLTQTHTQDLNRKLKGMSLTPPGLGGVCQVPPL